MSKQIEALKYALAAMEEHAAGNRTEFFGPMAAAREALAEQPAQQESMQETAWQALQPGPIKALHQARAALIGPVADGLARRCAVAAIDDELERPAQQQEPVAYIEHHQYRNYLVWVDPGGKRTPLYTSPPQRKPWVGLTDEEINEEWFYISNLSLFPAEKAIKLARAIEAKLKEKNT